MYQIKPQRIPQDRRADLNAKILYAIDADLPGVTKEAVYNCYTGKGGLHGLDRADYDNYNAYARAKRELEDGQFFTPHAVCREAAAVLDPRPGESLLDPCCGMGNVFNWCPEGVQCVGFDLDPNAVKVARHLYPEADITAADARHHSPAGRFQNIFLNPPFDLEFEDEDGNADEDAPGWRRPGPKKVKSQFWFVRKAAQWAEPGALLLLVVPQSFMADRFWCRGEVEAIEALWSFDGQAKLDDDAFSQSGVTGFATKLMLFHRRCESIPHTDFDASFITLEELKAKAARIRTLRQGARMALVREALGVSGKDSGAEELYKVRRILFHLHHNPALTKQYEDALALVEKFRTQKPPQGATREQLTHWEKYEKITPAKLLSRCRRALAKQSEVSRDEIRLVCDRRGVRVKAYSQKARRTVDDWYREHTGKTGYARHELVTSSIPVTALFPQGVFGAKFDSDCAAAHGRIERERREYAGQARRMTDIVRDAALDAWLENAAFRNARGEECRPTDLQKEDLGIVMQKRYAILNWQQGSGKTAAAYFFAKRLLESGKVGHVFVLAPALAVNLTWVPFLKANGAAFRLLRKPADVRAAGPGEFLLVSTTMVGTLKRPLMELTRRRLHGRACLLFDESDEITNPGSVRTLAILDVFRRLRYKLLLTGTTTRNNIGELYPQLELLYNNSANMLSLAPCTYEWDKDAEGFVEAENSWYGRPFPARRGYGAAHFRRCFSPGRATVFGIEKFSQDVCNADELNAIVGRTVITRRFRDFAGEKYDVTNHTVTPTEAEFGVYSKILNELHDLVPLYFHETGDARKESALRIMRTIELLIRACSVPSLMPGYAGESLPSKLGEILSMLREREGRKVAVGVTTVEALELYRDNVSRVFAHRPLFVVDGSVEFRKRDAVLRAFEATQDGILLCTQQSLKSSVNIPTCDEVILESLQWNIPKMAQFYFRFIRFDSERFKHVHFVTYQYTIEQNILALLLAKERLNEFLQTGQIADKEDVFSQYGVDSDLFGELMGKERDRDGGLHFTWGGQRVC